jgi:hypothetical protein
MQQELAREEIERMGHKIRSHWNIRHRATGKPLSLFFLDIEPADNNNEIYHIECLQNMRVQIEPSPQKKCKRCQAYFHNKGYGEHRPRCVRCGKSHSTEKCILPKAQLAKCLHCGESHPASYRGCKVYQQIIRSRFAPLRPIASNHLTNIPRQESENPAASQKTEGRSEMTCAQATSNGIETPKISANNTH